MQEKDKQIFQTVYLNYKVALLKEKLNEEYKNIFPDNFLGVVMQGDMGHRAVYYTSSQVL